MFRRTPSVLGCISVFVCKWFLKFTSFFFTEISDLGTHEDSGYRGNENGYSRLSVVVTLCSFIGSSGVIPLTHAPETDARNRRQFLTPVSGAGFWSVCHQHKVVLEHRPLNGCLPVDFYSMVDDAKCIVVICVCVSHHVWKYGRHPISDR